MIQVEGFEELKIPTGISTGIVSSRELPAINPDFTKELSASRSFSEWKKRPGNCLVIVNDGTRPTPTARVLMSDRGFFTSKNISYIVATGAHPGPEGGAWRQIFGELYESVKSRVFIHDAGNKAELVFLGKTSYGTEVRLNRIIERFDRILVIGSVEPHYFAGYTGGRKAFLPGIAGYDTITSNHKLAMEPGSGLLRLKGNPIHEDMAEAAKMLGDRDIFSVMTVLYNNHDVYSFHAGDLESSFNHSVADAAGLLSFEVPKPADIIISRAVSPLDRDLYQSHKAIENVRAALRPGGVIILVSECAEGIGESNFYELLSAGKTPSDVFARIMKEYRLGFHKSARLADFMRDSQLYAVTSLNPELLEAVFIKPFSSLQEAFDTALAAMQSQGLESPEVLVVQDGSFNAVFSHSS